MKHLILSHLYAVEDSAGVDSNLMEQNTVCSISDTQMAVQVLSPAVCSFYVIL